jgi:hypothetical protein
MTYRDAWRERAKVTINGKVWEAWSINPCKTEVILLRSVRVKTHMVGMNVRGSGWRQISIRRPVDAQIGS